MESLRIIVAKLKTAVQTRLLGSDSDEEIKAHLDGARGPGIFARMDCSNSSGATLDETAN